MATLDTLVAAVTDMTVAHQELLAAVNVQKGYIDSAQAALAQAVVAAQEAAAEAQAAAAAVGSLTNRRGRAQLVAGSKVVLSTLVTDACDIQLTAQPGGAAEWGAYRVTAKVVGVSFTISSSLPGDTATVAWLLY